MLSETYLLFANACLMDCGDLLTSDGFTSGLTWAERVLFQTGEMKSSSSERNQVVEPGQLILYNPLLHLSLVYFDTDQYKLSR